ncbi:MAG: MBL fold metallo-hydrolase [Winogradskyella sp.]|nr:MBL fold metallo-hydrolase [Winogradskyella sp.]
MKALHNFLILLSITLISPHIISSKLLAQGSSSGAKDTVKVIPISHGSLILEIADNTIYIDPTGGAEAYTNYKIPTIVLITDIHGDHLNLDTLNGLDLSNSLIIAPQAVIDKLPASMKSTTKVFNNDDTFKSEVLSITAIPMYNLREETLKFHPKGRGNGYIVEASGERIYISGDTEDIPEMRSLQNIDKAFVCMNLPYTMTIERAASAVLDFKPIEVFPYHYRGTNGFSDVEAFKQMVESENKGITVTLLKWY